MQSMEEASNLEEQQQTPDQQKMYNREEKPYREDKAATRSQRMRQRATNEGNDDTLAGLEQIFEAKLAAVRTYEKKLATVNDPYARKVLQNMIRDERRELINMAELAELVEQSPEMGGLTRTRRRLNHQVKSRTGKNLGFWLGAAAVGAVLLPSVREKLRPLAVSAVQGIMGLSEQAQGLFSGVREDLEDLVSEAQFEKFKGSIGEAIESDAVEVVEDVAKKVVKDELVDKIEH